MNNISDISDISPDHEWEYHGKKPSILIIACGALAKEILHIIRLNDCQHISLTCVPAKLHNRPHEIPDAVRAKIEKNKDKYDEIYAGFADCGTGGLLDKLLDEYGVKRLLGPHCYAFFSGQDAFHKLSDEELGSFYLTDYLARHFDSLIKKGMRLENPIVREAMFKHYKRLVYLAQTNDDSLDALAREAAIFLNLEYKRVFTGYGELSDFIKSAATP